MEIDDEDWRERSIGIKDRRVSDDRMPSAGIEVQFQTVGNRNVVYTVINGLYTFLTQPHTVLTMRKASDSFTFASVLGTNLMMV